MKRILIIILSLPLFWGSLMAQKSSKAEIARQLVIASKDSKSGIGVKAIQMPSETDLREMKVSSETFSSKSGLTHVYFQQYINKIPVHNGIMNVHVTKDNKLMSFDSRFVNETGTNVAPGKPSLSAETALKEAARQMGYSIKGGLVIKQSKGGATQQVVFAKGSLSIDDIPVKLVWQPVEDRLSPTHAISLKLAWDITIHEPKGQNWWNIRVDAITGIILDKSNLVVHCDFGDRHPSNLYRTDIPHIHSDKFKKGGIENYLFAGGGSYNVFPQPFESPYDGPRQLVLDPADATASPFGWHDINGIIGPEYTITRGNNVHAYTDVDADDLPDPGSSPDGGAGLLFDFPLDLNNTPDMYRPAAVTNLFYWNNYMHDFSYKYGFDELSGNFQVNNYGNGGLGNDYVLAEAQDGSGTNNANFGTPPDGSSPWMQMYLWVKNPAGLSVNSPAGIEGSYDSRESAFSSNNKLSDVGPVAGQVVYYNDDAGGSTHFACVVPANSVTGKIALVNRGNCNFTVKVKNAQDAGAIAVIVVNNVPGDPFEMGGVDNTITIPAVMISQNDGAIIAGELVNTVEVTLFAMPEINRDADLDNGIIAHEYGHGISTRLTGGPANVFCLNNLEQMGEGWSDFFTLMTTMKPGDAGTSARGIGNYSLGNPANGLGIRPQPYSTDMGINNSTYNTIKNPGITIPHGIGFVWATMVWEMTWALIDAHGQSAGFDEAMNLVMEGMKLQPCSPGFVDGRNAILAADQALYGGANSCLIWKAFAKRGLGLSASQGSSDNRDDGVEAFDLPEVCSGLSVGLPSGEILACLGTPSANPDIISIVISGNSITENIEVQASTHFEVSTDAETGYGNSLSLTSVGGSVPTTTIYVRSAASAPLGAISGNVTVSTTGQSPVLVGVDGFIGAASSAILSFSQSYIDEGFDIADPLPGGWAKQNLSTIEGTTGWFQGNPGVFTAQNGPEDSYIAANFNNTADANNISNWLFTPNIMLKNGDVFSFWTRTVDGTLWPDRLEVRMSTSGSSTNVGASDFSTGDFSTLLLSVNPDLTTTGYPETWTQYNVTISGLSNAVSGRLAFRYFVENAGPFGANSNYIGIDNVVYSFEDICGSNTSGNIQVDITGGTAPYSVTIDVSPLGQPPSSISVENYMSGDPIPVSITSNTEYSIASVEDASGCSGVGSSNTLLVEVNPIPSPVIVATPEGPVCPGSPVTLSFSGSISTTPCTNDAFGQWPSDDFSFSFCDEGFIELVADFGWAGEYSVVNVEAGKFYGFWSMDNDFNFTYLDDEITITDITGNTVYSSGKNYAYFIAGFTGKVRFYTHEKGCTPNDETFRQRWATCFSNADEFGLFSWSPGGETTSSIVVNPAVTTTYSLTLTNDDILFGLAGCEGTTSKEVQVISGGSCGLTTWYRDADRDGYGNPNPAFIKIQATRPRNYVANDDDCRDFDANTYPGAPELPDNVDNDCNGQVDDGLDCRTKWYNDKDGDGYGNFNPDVPFRWSCIPVAGYALNNLDCRDWDATVHPGVVEICDGRDNNCNGVIDEGCFVSGMEQGKSLTITQPLAKLNIETGEMQIYPNPARDEIIVVLNGFEAGKKLQLQLVQADGKVTLSQAIVPYMKNEQVKLDVRKMSSGYYLLQAKQGMMQQTKKVMIIR